MHTAQVFQWGQPPKYISLPTPPLPPPSSETLRITLLATGLHRLVRGRASGKHYSVKTLPHTPGSDGVGTTPDGQLVYFLCSPDSGLGSFCEIIDVPKTHVRVLPKGADPIQIAALVNPGLSSWMALRTRCENLPEGFSVLLMGATSASGRLAISLSRNLGAKRVVGCARNGDALKGLGLDEWIVLRDPVEETDFGGMGHVDVVLDYLYGPPAVHLLKTMKAQGRVQYVHVGGLAATEIMLPGAVLRSQDLVIRGSGLGSFRMKDVAREMEGLLEAMVSVEEQKVRVCKLSEVEEVWNEGQERVVFVP